MLIPSRNEAYYHDRVPQVSGSERCTMWSASLARGRSMSLKAQLDACRGAFEANRAPDVVAAVRRSIRELAQIGPVGKSVKAGGPAPLFRLRCGRGSITKLRIFSIAAPSSSASFVVIGAPSVSWN